MLNCESNLIELIGINKLDKTKGRFVCLIQLDRGQVYQANNSVIFSGKPMRSEEFFNRMVEALGITIDRLPKGRLRKMEN